MTTNGLSIMDAKYIVVIQDITTNQKLDNERATIFKNYKDAWDYMKKVRESQYPERWWTGLDGGFDWFCVRNDDTKDIAVVKMYRGVGDEF